MEGDEDGNGAGGNNTVNWCHPGDDDDDDDDN